MFHLFNWRACRTKHNTGRRSYQALRAILYANLFVLTAWAHEGHDHDKKETVIASEALARVIASSDQFELVGIAETNTLIIYVDRFNTNDPVTNADIEVTIGNDIAIAELNNDDVYIVSSELFAASGEHELIFSVTTPETADLLIGTLSIDEPQTVSDQDTEYTLLPWLACGLLLILGMVIGHFFGMRARPLAASAPSAVSLIVLGAFMIAPLTADAHEGHEHGAEDAAPPAGDRPARLPDGSVFLPKPTQRLLTIRTEIIAPVPAGRSYTLAGQTIPDPNASGVVQATSDGQIVKGQSDLPVLGQRVRRGEALADLIPAISADAGVDLANERASIEQSIIMLERRLERLRALKPISIGDNGESVEAVPKARLTDLEAELAALKTRRRNVQQFVTAPSAVRASADGVIARINFRPGEVVATGDTLFEVVDPAHVWAETALFADQNAPPYGIAFTGVDVIMPDGTAYDASPVGASAVLVNQARVMQFRIDTDEAIPIGSTVTIRLQTEANEEALLVPNEAVVRGATGLNVIWTHANAETFEPVIVDVEPYDGARMRVLTTLPGNARIVTTGASLLEQVR